jgi:hypothetical protein
MTTVLNGYKGKSHVSIGREKFVSGKSITFRIPQDIVVKEFIIVAKGIFTGVFPATAPKLRQNGVLDGIVTEISLSRRGTDRVRSYRGVRQLINTVERQFGDGDPTIYKKNATNLAHPALQGLPEFAATTQSTAFRESVTIMMENKLASVWYPTLFETQNLQTAVLNVICGDLMNIKDPEDAAVLTSITGDIDIEVFASCADWLLASPDIGKVDLVQTYEEKEFSGVQSQARHNLSPQGMLLGVYVTGIKETSKLFDFENMSNTRIEFRYQGIQIAEGNLLQYMSIDANKTLLYNHRRGSAYLSFLNNGDFMSGLVIGEGKNLEVTISTDPSMSYATPVKLIFEYDQLLDKPKQ